MLYTHHNARGAQVIDMDTKTPLDRVLELNSRAGWMKVARYPYQVDPHGKTVMSDRIRFHSIYPVQGAESRPVLFHCSGRQA